MSRTPIEWTEETINPIRARLGDATGHYCEKVGPECKDCYASRMQVRFRMPQFQEQRNAGVETFFDPKRLAQVLRRRTPTKFFWCDMTDMFGRWVPNEWIAACFGVMAATPQHTHQVLTKRADRLPRWFDWLAKRAAAAESSPVGLCAALASQELGRPTDFMPDEIARWPGWPLPNVWLGVSVGVRAAKSRLDQLRATPAAVRYVSLEPLLEDLGDIDLTGIDWSIIGGESALRGRTARPCDLAWIQSLVVQARAQRCAPFVKQLGSNPVHDWLGSVSRYPHTTGKGGDMAQWPDHLRVREWPAIG